MNMKRLFSLMLALALVASIDIPAFAADQPANKDGETTIPVTISAAASTFDVTVPTSFPSSVDPDTGNTTAPGNATIINNSSGAIVVSQIKVQQYGVWKLAAYDDDLRNAAVDSNLIGVSVQPKGGRSSGSGGTTLKTTSASATEQLLLTSASKEAEEWIIDAKNDGNTDELTIVYSTKVSPVSSTVSNEQAASVIITLRWYK